LKDLFYDMTQKDYNKRPNCERILENKYLWSMNRDEYNCIETVKSFPKPHSFVYHMIESKLNSNTEKSVDSTLQSISEKTKFVKKKNNCLLL
jgi:hypothetical protein